MQLDEPLFPPLLTPYAVAPSVDPIAHAARLCEAGECGAADVVWSRAQDRARMALVLEPDVALRQALQMSPLAMVAVADCLAALMPPKTAIAFRWPDLILLNGGAVGRVRLAASSVVPDVVPDWLAVGIELTLKPTRADAEPGDNPDITSLHAEGGGALSRSDILQSAAAHVLAWLDVWTHEGFEPVRARWLVHAGSDVAGLDDHGGLLWAATADGGARSVALSEAIDLASWRNEASP